MAAQLEEPALLLVGVEVRMSDRSLRETIATALALSDAEFDQATIILGKGGPNLRPERIREFAQANGIEANKRTREHVHKTH